VCVCVCVCVCVGVCVCVCVCVCNAPRTVCRGLAALLHPIGEMIFHMWKRVAHRAAARTEYHK